MSGQQTSVLVRAAVAGAPPMGGEGLRRLRELLSPVTIQVTIPASKVSDSQKEKAA